MPIDPNEIINELLDRIKALTLDNAMLSAALRSHQKEAEKGALEDASTTE